MACLRPLRSSDLAQVVAVYRDAVLSQAVGLYTQEQIDAWAERAGRDPGLREALLRGHGLASCAENDATIIEAFALLEPDDRLSLLYCRGRASRQGRGRALVQALEQESRRRGCQRIRTEASQLSRPLLLRLGWRVESEETLLFAGVWFSRWRMIKDLE